MASRYFLKMVAVATADYQQTPIIIIIMIIITLIVIIVLIIIDIIVKIYF